MAEKISVLKISLIYITLCIVSPWTTLSQQLVQFEINIYGEVVQFEMPVDTVNVSRELDWKYHLVADSIYTHLVSNDEVIYVTTIDNQYGYPPLDLLILSNRKGTWEVLAAENDYMVNSAVSIGVFVNGDFLNVVASWPEEEWFDITVHVIKSVEKAGGSSSEVIDKYVTEVAKSPTWYSIPTWRIEDDKKLRINYLPEDEDGYLRYYYLLNDPHTGCIVKQNGGSEKVELK